MARPTIITCALTGAADSVGKNPNVPVTPQQIADQGIAAAKAGAAVIHIHVRDPASGQASVEMKYYKEVVDRVRDSGVDTLINLTTGPGTLMTFTDVTPFQAKGGRLVPLMGPVDRVAHILELKPDICSLDIATMNFGEYAYVNINDHIRKMAAILNETSVIPELEVFDLGHVRLARHLIEAGTLKGPGYFQFCLGIPWGAPATAEVVNVMRGMVPEGAVWSAFGIAQDQFPIVAAAAPMGGNVRVGMEDNLYLARGKLVNNNAELVAKAVRILEELGHAIATPSQAKDILTHKAA